MSQRTLSSFILVFTILELVARTHLTHYDNSHGFISDKHERYLVDGMPTMHEELAAEVRNSQINLNINYMLRFEPEYLDFKMRPVGVPHLEKVTLYNIDSNRSIDMTSISGSTVHFHSSFFQDKKVPPLGNTSFNVVFLGREEGSIESNLFIHTTEGHFKYQVKGASVYSPYRLRPIVGIKLPLNVSFSPLIYMHNPHQEPIQITEMYSSGGEFHLELPSGDLEGPKDLWEIPPLQTKAVIRVRFHSKVEQNHTAYVRIKLNNTDETLVVPLEVQVTVNGGLYNSQGSIDFGVGGSMDPPKEFKLYLRNPFKKPTKIHAIYSSSKAIRIDYNNVKIAANTKQDVQVAILNLDWQTAFQNKDFSGKIVVTYKNGKGKSEIPYYVTVVKGGITYNSSSLRYFLGDKSEDVRARNIVLKNEFLDPVAIMNVSLPLEMSKYFQITKFTPGILKPLEEKSMFQLKMKSNIGAYSLRINSYVLLQTNVSTIELPLLSYNGRLDTYLPFKSKDNSLDVGLIGFNEEKDVHILLLNRNPIKVALNKVATSIPSCHVTVLGCGNENPEIALFVDSFENMTKCTYLRPSEYVILRLRIKTAAVPAQIWGDISLTTQHEQMSIPVHFRIAQGKIELLDRLTFGPCFPGKICSLPLKIASTFPEPMVIEDIISIPPDNRLSAKFSDNPLPKMSKVMAYIHFNPNVACINECYSGMQYDSITSQWHQSLMLPKTTADLDLNLVNVFYNRYLNQTSNGITPWRNITLRIDTSEVKGHFIKSRVKLSWPKLFVNKLSKPIVYFPLTQIGNVTLKNLTIWNPSSHNLIVQLVIDRHYPNEQLLSEGLPPDFYPNYFDDPSRMEHEFYFGPQLSKWKKNFDVETDLNYHQNTLPLFLKPGENFTFTMAFKPTESSFNSGRLFLRNNLTVLEVVQLSGIGAHPNFKFGNRRPGSSQPLVFELTEKHLKDCEREKNRRLPPTNLSVKRSFTARNSGDLVIHINNFYINGLPCEGFGFKILYCEPFTLQPNGTKKIDIAFTPDFTLAKITRTLTLETSLNIPVNYSLMTTIPSYYLALCSSVLTRPPWEKYIYYGAIIMMIIALGCVVIMPLIDSDKIVKDAMNNYSRHGSPTKSLNLKLVGIQTKAEMQCQKEIKECKFKHDVKLLNGFIPESPKEKEPEKYTVLIPAISKGKKKLSKKNNFDISEQHEMQKKPWAESFKSKARPIEVNKLPQETETYVCKKSNYNTNKTGRLKFDLRKHTDAKLGEHEEESSSTTTESSNNDELDTNLTKTFIRKFTSSFGSSSGKQVKELPQNEAKFTSGKEGYMKEPKENTKEASYKENVKDSGHKVKEFNYKECTKENICRNPQTKDIKENSLKELSYKETLNKELTNKVNKDGHKESNNKDGQKESNSKDGLHQDSQTKDGFHKESYIKANFHKNSSNKEGSRRDSCHKEGFNQPYDKDYFNRDSFNKDGSYNKDIFIKDSSVNNLNRGVPYKDVFNRDVANKDIFSSDVSNRNDSNRDGLNKDISNKDASNKDIYNKDMFGVEILNNELSNKKLLNEDLSNKDVFHKEAPKKDIFYKNQPAKELFCKEGFVKDASNKEGIHKDSNKEMYHKESNKDIYRKESVGKNMHHKESPNKDLLHKESPRSEVLLKEPHRKESFHKELNRKDSIHKESALRNSVNYNDTFKDSEVLLKESNKDLKRQSSTECKSKDIYVKDLVYKDSVIKDSVNKDLHKEIVKDVYKETLKDRNKISEEIKPHAKVERKRSQPKTVPKNKDTSDVKHENKHSGEHRPVKNRSSRDRKEKHGRRQSDKSTNTKNNENGTNSCSSSVRTSPSLQASNIWGENKASFSDVVSRNDNLSTNSKVFSVPLQSKMSDMCKKSPAELGPIGSKPDSSPLQTRISEGILNDDFCANGVFTETHLEGNGFLGNGCWNTGNVSAMPNYMQHNDYSNHYGGGVGEISSQVQGNPWNPSGFWDYGPITNIPTAPTTSQPQNGYLWGSSSVWQPWAPEYPRTPTRTPPGFAPQHRDLEERSAQLRESDQQIYNPFGLSNIWSQEWNYSEEQ